MSEQPLVSCIIIFLNAERFMKEAIESILDQSYGHWELLLVDDGSTDQSTALAKQYVEQHPERIFYHEHENHQNRGLSASRNLGIRFAKGKYIAFLDADDIWLPNKLERQIPLLEARPEAGMVYGSLYFWYSWTGAPEDAERDFEASFWNFPDLALVTWPTYLPRFIQERVVIPSPTCMVMRRDIAERVGGFEEEFRRGFYDDQVFVVKMSLAAPIILQKGYFEKYRQHRESITYISENITGEGQRMRKVFLNWVKNYLLEAKVENARLSLVLDQELFLDDFPHLHQLYRRAVGLKDRMAGLLNYGIGKSLSSETLIH